MTNVGLHFREWLSGALQVVQDELDQVIAGVQGTWNIEHNADGTHGTITPDRVEVGGLVLTDGALRFPTTQIISTQANTLDDYEEGTWTPALTGSGGGSGQVYSTQRGQYVKIGRWVWCAGEVQLSTEGTITTNLRLTGLPFTSENINNKPVGQVSWAGLATTWVHISLNVNASATTADIVGAAAAAASNQTSLTAADVNDTSQFLMTFAYRAAS